MKNNKLYKWLWITIIGILIILISSGIYASYNHHKVKNNENSTIHKNPGNIHKSINKAKERKSDKSNHKNKFIKNKSKKNKKANQTSAIPNQFVGTWYEKNKKIIISPNKIEGDEDALCLMGQTTITNTSSPLKINVQKSNNNSYAIYNNPNGTCEADQKSPIYYWLGTLTIDGKKQQVLAGMNSGGWAGDHFVNIATKNPTNKDYKIKINGISGTLGGEIIGNSNLDELKNKANKIFNNDSTNDTDSNNKSSNHNSSDNDSSQNNENDPDNNNQSNPPNTNNQTNQDDDSSISNDSNNEDSVSNPENSNKTNPDSTQPSNEN